MTRRWVVIFKRSVKVVISTFFFWSISITRFLRKLAGSQAPVTYVVLYYHAVPAPSRDRFARQMDILRRLATPISADSSNELVSGKKYVAITFDDGLLSVIDNAVPAIIARKIPVTLFVVAGRVGLEQNWAVLGSEYDKADRLATTEELKSLPKDLITIGSHTMFHRVLPSLDREAAADELTSSRQTLEKLLGTEISLFSFPYGAFNSALVDMCRAAGYKRVFTTMPMTAHSDPDEFVTGRVSADPTDWDSEFRLKMSGAYSWMTYVSEVKQKLRAYFLPDKLDGAMRR